MKYCILETENHPDRLVESVYGPYDSREEAAKEATRLYNEPSNYNAPYKHYFYDFRVREMTK